MNTECGRPVDSSKNKKILSSVNTHVGPLWSRDGKEIVYASSNLIIAMSIDENDDYGQRYFV